MSSADTPGPTQEPTLAPEDVSDRTFPTAFRGFDPVEVRAFLGQVADQLRTAYDRETELRQTIESLQSASATVEAGTETAANTVEEAREEADRLVEAARHDAGRVVAEAKEEADRVLREAKDRVAQLGHAATAESARVLDEAKSHAQQVVRAKGDEAEATAVKKLADAERDAAAIRVKAREDADAILEAAKERGREMVSEAQSARERLIADITKRKRVAANQLEQLRTGRDRLLESLRVVRRNLDEITTRLEATEGAAPPVAALPESPPTGTPAAAVTSPQGNHAGNGDQANGDGPRQETRRAPRSSRVMLGELPSPPTAAAPAAEPGAPPAGTAPPTSPAVVTVRSQPGPRIDAPRARVAGDPGGAAPPSGDRHSTPNDGDIEPQPPERRSSALRILRRGRGAGRTEPAVPAQVGRDSTGEGIRIIRSESDDQADAAAVTEPPSEEARETPAVDVAESADAVVPGKDIADGGAAEVEPPSDVDEVESPSAAAAVDAAVATEPATESETAGDESDATGDEATYTSEVDEPSSEVSAADLGPDDLPPPLRPEEVRPRIEDLFARIRADREQAVAKAREVLADDGSPDAGERDAGTAEVKASAVEPSAEPDGDADATAEAGDHGGTRTDAEEHLLQARDAVLDPLVGQLTRRLKRSIQDEQNATLDRLRTARPRPQADDVLANADTQPAPYRYAAVPLLGEAARAAAAAAPFGTVAVGVDDLAQTLAEELCSQIRGKVDRVLVEAAEEDVDLQTASERVSSVYREWKTQRVEVVATHHLVAAWSRGTFVATPEGTPMRWVVDDDGPCPDCDDNALAGATPRGQTFPTGQLHPPAHPGCRCLLAPAHG